MTASELIIRITSESVDTIMANPQPLLIGCFRKDGNFHLNLVTLELTALFFQEEIKVYYALEEMHPYFKTRFGVAGTPTYILTQSGAVLGTLPGKFPPGKMIAHISQMLTTGKKQSLPTILQANMPQREQ